MPERAARPVRPARLVEAVGRNPQMALHLLSRLPAASRREALRRWSLPPGPSVASCEPPTSPRAEKCSPVLATDARAGQAAQLEAFARQVGRVG